MNILLTILIIIAALFVLLLITAALMKKEYAVQQQAIINKNSREVFDYIKLLKNQRSFNKWAMMDPDAKMDYIGTDGTVGFIYTWDSENKNVGKGEQEIKSISDNTRIDSEVRFEKPFKNVADVFMETKAVSENQTRVTWAMNGKNPYPMNIMNLIIPGMLSKDMGTSLNNLKNIMEN
ncbi:SRPBCC family protein [Mucilaginibacter sp. BJC16-A38]|uniref:SRPBCC family protein n=1 Tax=Mucilaginibacter phenanthrenivorans TaxID=1234842 RepID=UPI002157A9B2|nr:SRPBCC family protein [Mucilaginibacter phenanthrenivorans]MCR8556633.1 SRPBCC family protein [Mucilaginibacter phenanthrenivorans]